MRAQSTTQDAQKDALANIDECGGVDALIDEAAKSVGKKRSDFMRDAAFEKAQEMLLEFQTKFILNEEEWEAFNAILDNPPEPSEKLLKFLATNRHHGNRPQN